MTTVLLTRVCHYGMGSIVRVGMAAMQLASVRMSVMNSGSSRLLRYYLPW